MYFDKECHKYNEDTRTDKEVLNELEADVAQILLNQRRMNRMLASLVGKDKKRKSDVSKPAILSTTTDSTTTTQA